MSAFGDEVDLSLPVGGRWGRIRSGALQRCAPKRTGGECRTTMFRSSTDGAVAAFQWNGTDDGVVSLARRRWRGCLLGGSARSDRETFFDPTKKVADRLLHLHRAAFGTLRNSGNGRRLRGRKGRLPDEEQREQQPARDSLHVSSGVPARARVLRKVLASARRPPSAPEVPEREDRSTRALGRERPPGGDLSRRTPLRHPPRALGEAPLRDEPRPGRGRLEGRLGELVARLGGDGAVGRSRGRVRGRGRRSR